MSVSFLYDGDGHVHVSVLVRGGHVGDEEVAAVRLPTQELHFAPRHCVLPSHK